MVRFNINEKKGEKKIIKKIIQEKILKTIITPITSSTSTPTPTPFSNDTPNSNSNSNLNSIEIIEKKEEINENDKYEIVNKEIEEIIYEKENENFADHKKSL